MKYLSLLLMSILAREVQPYECTRPKVAVLADYYCPEQSTQSLGRSGDAISRSAPQCIADAI